MHAIRSKLLQKRKQRSQERLKQFLASGDGDGDGAAPARPAVKRAGSVPGNGLFEAYRCEEDGDAGAGGDAMDEGAGAGPGPGAGALNDGDDGAEWESVLRLVQQRGAMPARKRARPSAGGAVAGAGAGAESGGEDEPEWTQAPADPAVRVGLRVSSETEFDWCATISGGAMMTGIGHFLREDVAGCQGAARLQEALMYFRFPASGLPPAFAQSWALKAAMPQPNVAFMERRRQEYVAALRNLYLMVRSDQCAEFVWRSDDTSILVRSQPTFEAIVGRSSKGIRGALEKRGVPFEMPLAPETLEDVEIDHEVLQEARELNAHRNTQGVLATRHQYAVDMTPRSMLLCRGRDAVHALYEYLVNFQPSNGDVPTLLCSKGFLNAQLAQLEVTRVGKVQVLGGASNGRSRHEIEIAGPVILGSNFVRITEAIRMAHADDFAVASRLDRTTLQFRHGTSADEALRNRGQTLLYSVSSGLFTAPEDDT